MSLGRVLDNAQSVLLRQLEKRIHIHTLTIEMNRHDGAGLGPHRSSNCFGVDQRRTRVDVDQHGRGAGETDSERRRNESKGRHDHLVARTDVQDATGEVQSIRAAAHADAELGTAILRELGLKQLQLFAQYEIAARQYSVDRGVDLALYGRILRPQVYQRDDRFGSTHDTRLNGFPSERLGERTISAEVGHRSSPV